MNSYQRYKRRQFWREVRRELPVFIAHVAIGLTFLFLFIAAQHS
jgi:hypothetical protein